MEEIVAIHVDKGGISGLSRIHEFEVQFHHFRFEFFHGDANFVVIIGGISKTSARNKSIDNPGWIDVLYRSINLCCLHKYAPFPSQRIPKKGREGFQEVEGRHHSFSVNFGCH